MGFAENSQQIRLEPTLAEQVLALPAKTARFYLDLGKIVIHGDIFEAAKEVANQI